MKKIPPRNQNETIEQHRVGDIFFNGVTIQKPSIVMVGAGHHPFSEETLGERQYNYILGE